MNARSFGRKGLVRAASVGCLVLSLAAGCSTKASTNPDAARPVKTIVISAGDELHTRAFPGKAEAAKNVTLAFQVPGLIVKLPVKEGQKVVKGEVIAQLRPDEFQARLNALQGQLDRSRAVLRSLRQGARPEEKLRLEAQVRAAEANLVNARSSFERDERGLRSNVISRADFDAGERAYRIAQEEHKSAIQLLEKGTIAREEDIEAKEAEVRGLEAGVVEANIQLTDSTLRAPYDGVIAQRFVEEKQNIMAKAPVVRFQDADEIEVAVDVPETVMAADIRRADIVELVAEFSGAPGLAFPVQIREVAQVADPVTQTFKVRAALKSPANIRILPGMTATVTATYRRASILGNRILVPVTAVLQRASGEQVAWVLGTDGAVSPRTVKLGAATGDRIEVLDGLQPGDRVVVAGVRFLREGMKVKDLGDALGGSQP